MDPMRVRPGDVLGKKYRVEKVLGKGGMGVVVSATHLDLDQRVAVKLMLPSAFKDPASRARFKREAQSAVKLRSEHAARVLDTGVFDDGSPYIVMEFLEGNDLAAELARVRVLTVEAIAEYVLQACDAIAEAHALGIVHRDLKPANMFLTRRHDGSPLVKVLDFGISKASVLDSAALAMTTTASMLGSPLYMSPEQMRSSRDVDARTDVWSLGIVLYELFTGRVPFEAETLGDLLARVMMDPQTPLVRMRPDVPPDISKLVDRCLEKDRAHRAVNVAEVARALGPYVPRRSVPLVERIVKVLEASTPPVGAAVPPAFAIAVASPPAAPSAPAPASSAIASTSRAWGGTERGRRSTRNTAAAWVAIGGIATVGLAGGAYALKAHRARTAPIATVEPPSPTVAAPSVDPEPAPTIASSAASNVAASPPVAAPPSLQVAPAPDAGVTRKDTPKAPPVRPLPPPARTTASSAATVSPRATPTASAKKPGILDTSE
jgi:eukaryotic-like serine/threonine-protein kinase